MATASSGLTLFVGSRLNIDLTDSSTLGILVMPPTKITSSISFISILASFNACLHGATVFPIKSFVKASKVARDKLRFICLGPVLSAVINGKLISVYIYFILFYFILFLFLFLFLFFF